MSHKDFFEISDFTRHLFSLGWAERNGGNISIRLNQNELDELKLYFHTEQILELPEASTLSYDKNIAILMTVSGSRFRILHKDLFNSIGVLLYNAELHSITWLAVDKANKPSSEWMSHLSMHLYLVMNNIDKKCIVHTHPTELIALSHRLYGKPEQDINNLLWSMMPEVKIFVPQGLAILPLMDAGSYELATASKEKLHEYSVILWAKHGCLALGNSLWESFEYIDIINKAAKIYLLAY